MLRRDIRYQAAIIQNGQVLLLQMRSPEGEVFWLPPGGGREGNETPEECLKREMREETELEVHVERLLFTQPDIPGGIYDQLHTYLCRPISGTARAGSEPEMARMPVLDIQDIAWFDLYDSSAWPPLEDVGKITLAWLEKLRLEHLNGYSEMTFLIQKALPPDIDYLALADLRCGAEEDGMDEPPELKDHLAYQRHRIKIEKFILDKQKGAWIGWTEDRKPTGMLLCRFRDKLKESPGNFYDGTIFGELNTEIFPQDGRFVEIFQLCVEPEYRRVGLATQLKKHVEVEAAQRHIGMIYTHTLEANFHVLELNHKLGYKEVRRGPIWDDAIRVSLVKHILIKEK